jgi:hypothetical protein
MKKTVVILMQSISFLYFLQILQCKSFSILLSDLCELAVIVQSLFDSLVKHVFVPLLGWFHLYTGLLTRFENHIRQSGSFTIRLRQFLLLHWLNGLSISDIKPYGGRCALLRVIWFYLIRVVWAAFQTLWLIIVQLLKRFLETSFFWRFTFGGILWNTNLYMRILTIIMLLSWEILQLIFWMNLAWSVFMLKWIIFRMFSFLIQFFLHF